MTTTKTLIEAATLTEEEIDSAKNIEQAEGPLWWGDNYAAFARAAAAAARDKALWACVDWLRTPYYGKSSQHLEEVLIYEGIERPKE